MTQLLAVAAGGALGALARWGVSVLIQSRTGLAFPWGTLGVNLLGCLVIGVVYGLFQGVELPQAVRLFVTLGFLGAFTTFSTFGYESVNLLQQGHPGRALAYVALSVMAGLALVVAGLALGRGLVPGR